MAVANGRDPQPHLRHLSLARRYARAVTPLLALAAMQLAAPSRASAACSQTGHAWFDYTQPGQTSVGRGDAIWLAAAGVVGNVKFTFFGPGGGALDHFTGSANGNCVVNQELFLVNFLPGTYTVAATFQDGNTNRLVIDAFAGTLTVVEPPTPPPGFAWCGQPAHLFLTTDTVQTGSSITAGGVAFPGTFSQIRLKHKPTKALLAQFYLPPAGSNCVQNHVTVHLSVPPGEYIVRADFIDENNVLHNDRIGTLTVTP